MVDRKRKRVADTLDPFQVSDDQILDEPTTKKSQQRRTLFVRSLPGTASTDTLISHFSASFPIRHATAVIDPATNQCKGFGFVTFADAEDAAEAQSQLDNSTFEGRKIKIEIAEPRHRDLDVSLVDGLKPARSKSQPPAALRDAKAQRDNEVREARRPPKLIVRNLPWSIKTSDDLAKLFMSFGKIKVSKLPTKKSGTLQGFGFVTLRGKKNAEKALEHMNGKVINGRTLAVDWAVEKEIWANHTQEDEDQFRESPALSTASFENDDLDPLGSTNLGHGDEDEDDHASLAGSDSQSNNESLPTEEMDDHSRTSQTENNSSTLFIRNLPFTCNDETLADLFSRFGKIRYARTVVDANTERPRGTGFVCFYRAQDALECLKKAPKSTSLSSTSKGDKGSSKISTNRSVLQSEENDPTGMFTIDGRVLQVTSAVDRSQAAKLTEEGVARRHDRDKDKRRLYLLSEGTIPTSSPLYESMPQIERDMRDASSQQRKKLVQNNPSLHLSLTRLSVRNIPRSTTSKDLKALAREAVVAFAKDVKAGKRAPLSKEELSRAGQDMRDAERTRKLKGTGIVKQAKVVFEDKEGHKMSEANGAGRSRGYGFIEYHSHRSALMGLRWLNGHGPNLNKKDSGPQASASTDKRKRLIVEFAVENAQVVMRRRERESKGKISQGSGTGKLLRRGAMNAGHKESGKMSGEIKSAKTMDMEASKKNRSIVGKKRAFRKRRKDV